MQLGATAMLFVLMTVVGLELSLADFRRVARRPRTVWIGALGQVTLLPLFVGTLLYTTDFPPAIVGGAILVTAAPGAGASNLLTLIARGDVALSVTLTAIGSLVSVFSIPVIVATGFEVLLGSELEISIPVTTLTLQLVFALLLPIALGMWIRQRRPDLAARWKRTLGRAVAVGFVVLTVGAVVSQREYASEMSDLVVPGLQLAALWAVAAAAAGGLAALAAGCRGPEALAVVIEHVAKNSAVAALIALGSLERLDLAIFAGPYMIVCFPTVALGAWLHRRSRPAGAVSPESFLR